MAERGSVSEAIAIEQSRHILNNLLTSVVGGFFIACVLVTMFWPVVDHAQLVVWLTINLVLSGWRLEQRRRFLRAPSTYPNARAAMRYALAGAIGSGLLWAATTAFMMPSDNVLYQLALVFAISMMNVAAMFSFGVHLPMFIGFFLPSMSATVVALIAKGTPLDFEIAAGIAIFVVVALRFVTAFQRIFVRAHELRFENTALVSQLSIEKEAAEQANLAKSRFLAAASHDLRQPMHALNLYLGTLAGQELLPAARSVVGHAQQCADTMDELFRGLLDISRLDAGAVQAHVGACELALLTERIRIEFDPQARERGLELRVVPTRLRVMADPALVERILRNLTVNALRYTAAGGVLIGCRRRAGGVRIAVYDTGVGIAPEHQKAVFEEFFQVNNPNRDRTRGIGLGLAIVERLARLMDAEVTLRSQPGRGSMFAIDLPAAAAQTRRAPETRAPADFAALSGALIVVVDDEAPILDAMRGLLSQWGAQVVTARSGVEALTQLAAAPRAPDALICDFRLAEGEDGGAVIGKIRAEFNEDIPALILTGDTGPDRLKRIEASGHRVLHKPIDTETLKGALALLLAETYSAGA